jgi:hypothetical protein
VAWVLVAVARSLEENTGQHREYATLLLWYLHTDAFLPSKY